jgi:predicted Zn-dependent protease with MMP-like domain
MAVRMSEARFEELVADALDAVPREFLAAMSNVVVQVEPVNPGEPRLLGRYTGIALTERTTDYAMALPDQIVIYRDPILARCDTEDEVVRQVTITVVHEIGHHFGIDDDRLTELGWG